MENRRLDRYATIDAGHRPASNGEFHQGADKARFANGQRRQQRQSSGNGLPEQVVRYLESRPDATVPTLRQRCPGLSRPVRLMSRRSCAHSDRTSESASLHRTGAATTLNCKPDQSASPSHLFPRPTLPGGVATLTIPERPTASPRRFPARSASAVPPHTKAAPLGMKHAASAHPGTRYNERQPPPQLENPTWPKTAFPSL